MEKQLLKMCFYHIQFSEARKRLYYTLNNLEIRRKNFNGIFVTIGHKREEKNKQIF